jgi:DNA-directed RNA polymerase specialized sigma24 family protein
VKTFFISNIPANINCNRPVTGSNVGGFTQQEIASISGIPPHNIGSNVKRERAGLTEAYQPLAEELDTVTKRRPV